MASDGQIVFEVTADGRQAISDVRDITRTIQNETRNWDRSASEATENIGNSFGSMLKKIAAGFSIAKIGKSLIDFGKDAVEAASNLEEVQNVVDVTFGKDSAIIDNWAKKAGQAFGLTETQAKKYTSTIGAMLKSSGLAGDQIVTMSTDLAGLAADMASFYNMDFDEAFGKLRSGISGQTMPLKELGIDMSVATLNAFALEKGLAKTFDQMSQSEQTMLRYEYIMKATADAQGDFSRTSDGYANTIRRLQTNIEELKTSLGAPLLNVLSTATGWLSDFIARLTPRADEPTYLDRIAEIDVNLDAKKREISTTADLARHLIGLLEELGMSNIGASVAGLSAGLNALGADTPNRWQLASDAFDSLDSSSPELWGRILTTLTGVDGLENLFGENSKAADNINALASALAGNSEATSKAEAWKTLLEALKNNIPAISQLTGMSAKDTAAWLDEMSTAANKLDPSSASGWNDLLGKLLQGLPGLADTDAGREFLEAMSLNFLSMGTESEQGVAGLKALGFGVDEISQKQATWLATCKELVKTLPGLGDIIDTNTGEIKGGLPALQEYVDNWEKMSKYQAEMNALQGKWDIYQEANNPTGMKSERIVKRSIAEAKLAAAGYDEAEIKKRLDDLEAMMPAFIGYKWAQVSELAFDYKNSLTGADVTKGKYIFGASMLSQGGKGIDDITEHFDEYYDTLKWVNSVTGDADDALQEYLQSLHHEQQTLRDLPQIEANLADQKERVAEEYGTTTEAIEAEIQANNEAVKAMSTLERAALGDAEALDEVTNATNNANEALQALADYTQSVRDSVSSSVRSTVKGFGEIETASERAKNLKVSIEGEVDETKLNQLKAELAKTESTKLSAAKIGLNLADQADYMDQYLEKLNEARARGIDNEILAELSDGSVESYDILEELANASDGEVETINANYKRVSESRKQLEDELSKQKLSVDETYKTLQEKAKEAVDALDLEQEAKDNTGKTIRGIAEGIGENVEPVREAVDGIIAQLERLSGFGINIDLGGFGNIEFTTSTGKTAGSGRFGMDYVPRDDYIMRLHEGEKVLSAQEASIYRGLANGSLAGVDLDSLGGVMRDNIRPGGNVYLDGKIVGAVVSDRQGRAYKSLQRSGWQS